MPSNVGIDERRNHRAGQQQHQLTSGTPRRSGTEGVHRRPSSHVAQRDVKKAAKLLNAV
jgi:hypothetical protein